MTAAPARDKKRIYALLLFIETLAALVIVTGVIPIYLAIVAAPGHPLAKLPQSPTLLFAALLLFQCVYWFRLLRVPVAVGGQSLILSHLVLFSARLIFVFGTSLFVLIMLRHIPSIDMQALPNLAVLVARGGGLLVLLFSMYCYSTELERLGAALRPATH
jgi:hypothetical protein